TQSIYNESEALFIFGRLDQAVLNESLRRLQSRHVAFCMVPEVSQGSLVRWSISDTTPIIPLQIFDWDKDHGDISGILRDEARKPFEFRPSEPLIRFALHRFASGEDVIQFTAHHMIIDGLSERQLWINLSEIYGTVESGKGCD